MPNCNQHTSECQFTKVTWLQAIVVLISSPLALLVALAGMTNKVITQREQCVELLPHFPPFCLVSLRTGMQRSCGWA